MRIIDRCVLRNKRVEKMLRDLDHQVEILENASKLDKNTFMEIFTLTLELMIEAYRTMENNTTPAKTLLDYTGNEINDACNRVGSSHVFSADRDFVIAVLQELTK